MNNQSIEQAKELNMSIMNLTMCEIKLKKLNVIGENDTLGLIKTDWDNGGGDIINFKLFAQTTNIDLITGKNKVIVLDKKLCEEEPVFVSVKLKDSSSNLNNNPQRRYLNSNTKQQTINLTQLHNLRNRTKANVLDQNAPFYNDICYSFNEDEKDFILNSRRTNFYMNKSISCYNGDNRNLNQKNSNKNNNNQTKNCEYENVDDDSYMTCKCKSTDVNDVSHDIGNALLDALTSFNIRMIGCPKTTFIDKEITQNLGFRVCVGLTCAAIFIVAIEIFILQKSYIKSNIASIFKYDAKHVIVSKDLDSNIEEKIPQKILKSKNMNNTNTNINSEFLKINKTNKSNTLTINPIIPQKKDKDKEKDSSNLNNEGSGYLIENIDNENKSNVNLVNNRNNNNHLELNNIENNEYNDRNIHNIQVNRQNININNEDNKNPNANKFQSKSKY